MSVRVLLADDDIDAMAALAELLEADGASVVACACDREEAVRFAAFTTPDVAVIDARMPSMEGPRTAASLRRLIPQPAVVLITTDEPAPPSPGDDGLSMIPLRNASPDLIARVVRRAAAERARRAPRLTERSATVPAHPSIPLGSGVSGFGPRRHLWLVESGRPA